MPKIYNLGTCSSRLKGVQLVVGEGLCSNMYIIGKEQATLIDTGVGNFSNPVWPQINQIGLSPENIANILLTHYHHDHAMGTYIILEKACPKVYIHKSDAKQVSRSITGLIEIEEGDTISTEIWPLEVLWTPGHTYGSICFYVPDYKVLFSGDTVFPHGYFGRCDGVSGSYVNMLESIKKLSEIDVEVMLPGHGIPIFEKAGDHIQEAYRNAKKWIKFLK